MSPPSRILWAKRFLLMLLLTAVIFGGEALGLGDTSSKESRRKAGSLPLRSLPTTLEHLVAGTIGGMSGVLISYPLDTVRVRMQTHGNLAGPARTASLLLQKAGVAGFYRGVFSPLIGTGLVKASVFGGYGVFQSMLRRAKGRDGGDLTLFHLGAAAMGSGFVGSFVITPVERIKVVMQAGISSAASSSRGIASFVPRGGAGYGNAWGCARGLVADHGVWRGLYTGLGPTLLREVPGYAFYFATYEACKRLLPTAAGDSDTSRGTALLKTALSGGLAGIAAWLPVYPIDVVKSRMQSVGGQGLGIVSTATLMWRNEGLASFYRGLAPTLARATVNTAATFLVYEAVIEWTKSGERHRERELLEENGRQGKEKEE